MNPAVIPILGVTLPSKLWHAHCEQSSQLHSLMIQAKVVVFLSFAIIEQDQGLEALSGIIQRQKMMGQAISDEVDVQNG